MAPSRVWRRSRPTGAGAGTRANAPEAPLLALSGVAKRRADGCGEVVVLENVTFELAAGEAMGVYGQRRSGKSTLLRLAAALETPDAGSVRFAGKEYSRATPGMRARLLRGPIALLSAEDWLPGARETVLDHVATAVGSSALSLREARRRAMGALDDAGVASIAAEDLASGLSAVERARVMLARALVREPLLLLVDEPAPLPSVIERERFCASLRRLARERGVALLVASEELACLQGLPVLASLSGGELCCTREQAKVVQLPRRRAAAAAERS
jgi:ABC-type multidrug transport system ATPase subunit